MWSGRRNRLRLVRDVTCTPDLQAYPVHRQADILISNSQRRSLVHYSFTALSRSSCSSLFLGLTLSSGLCWWFTLRCYAVSYLQMPEQQLLKLDEVCRSKGVKLLVVRSYGLMGYMRVSRHGIALLP